MIVPVGVYAYLGFAYGAEIDTLFVVALLTVLGVSISDTIVIFDRVRENLKKKISGNFEDVVATSLSQSFTRSINTSLTVVIVLLALFFFGPEPTKWFALTLVTGMIVGTYSSIFVASPLLTIVEKWQRKG
jgi:preprotein translocase subunit SecF